MTDIIKVSVSQIENFSACKRKWGWRYLNGLKSPPSRAAQFGIDGHKILEEWVRNATPIPNTELGKLVRFGIKPGYVPTPKTIHNLEHRFEILFPDWGVIVVGVMDFLDLHNRLVGDYKFRSQARYNLSTKDLECDLQANVYAYAAQYPTQNSSPINLRWIYFNKNSAEKVSKVEGQITAEGARTVLNKYLPIVQEMSACHRQNLKAEDLELNTSECSAYGGCPYLDNCLPLLTKFDDKTNDGKLLLNAKATKENKMNLFEKLKKQQEELGAKGVNPEPETAAKEQSAKPTPEPTKAEAPKEIKVPTPKVSLQKNGKMKVITLWGAVPAKGLKAIMLGDLLSKMGENIAHENGKEHWLDLEYNEPYAKLAVAFSNWLDVEAKKDEDLVFYVDPQALTTKAVREIITSRSDILIKGTL